jgi:hypothetical protein
MVLQEDYRLEMLHIVHLQMEGQVAGRAALMGVRRVAFFCRGLTKHGNVWQM